MRDLRDLVTSGNQSLYMSAIGPQISLQFEVGLRQGDDSSSDNYWLLKQKRAGPTKKKGVFVPCEPASEESSR